MSLSKYLAAYAEPQVHAGLPNGHWRDIVVVPLFDERDLVPDLLESLSRAAGSASPALAILVVNAAEAAPPSAHLTNEALLRWLDTYPVTFRGAGVSLHAFSPMLDLLVVDRASAGRRFPEKQGVGLARKIGADLAVRLRQSGAWTGGYFHTTDADARVAVDYFALPDEPGVAAWIHPFHHRVPTGERPLTLYEISLRYYVLGLRYAGSAYAFHTVGSTLAIGVDAYVQVRGFPRREAAEDFYLINKLAKVGAVRAGGGSIALLPRPSHRVPFGTGRSMERIGRELDEGREFHLYHPASFGCLKRFLQLGEAFIADRHWDRLVHYLQSDGLGPVSDALGVAEALRQAKKTRPTATALRDHWRTWFDAFRTLKFIHFLRDESLPMLPWETALDHAPFARRGPCPNGTLTYLRSVDH